MIAFIRRELVNHQVRPPVFSVDVVGQVGRCKTMVKRAVKRFNLVLQSAFHGNPAELRIPCAFCGHSIRFKRAFDRLGL